jgi:CheY-like chemotaxis protein
MVNKISSSQIPLLAEKKTKAKILVVDDDPEITESFGSVLEDSGLYQVVKHTDPNEVLSDLKPGDYYLVLLDIKMPSLRLRVKD